MKEATIIILIVISIIGLPLYLCRSTDKDVKDSNKTFNSFVKKNNVKWYNCRTTGMDRRLECSVIIDSIPFNVYCKKSNCVAKR